MQKFKAIQLAGHATVAAVVFLLVVTSCNDDKPTEPKPPKDYPVYILNNASSLITYHPLTTTVDSVAVPWTAKYGITVSADGERLYLARAADILVVDIDSLSPITTLPYAPLSPVAVSPDNQYIGITGQNLVVLNADDYTVAFSDTDRTRYGVFSADGETFYCVPQGNDSAFGFVATVDLSGTTPALQRQAVPVSHTTGVVPSPDQSRVFLYVLLGNSVSSFEVYHIGLDSVVFRHVFSPNQGKISVTPDGKYAIYTNPGGPIGPPPPGTFMIYAVEANDTLAAVSTLDYVRPPCACPAYTMAVTPDSDWLVTMGGGPLIQQVLYLYDFKKHELVDYIDFGRGADLSNPTAPFNTNL